MGCLDELVHVLKEFLRGDTGIDLCLVDVRVAEHTADGFQRHALFERYQAGERVASLMVVDRLFQPDPARYAAQMGVKGAVEHIREERLCS